jgi:hypothetical protein
MQSIGSILTKQYSNPTLQRAFLTHTIESNLSDVLSEIGLEGLIGTQLNILPKTDDQNYKLLHIYCSSSNSTLLTHLKLQSETIQNLCVQKLNANGTLYSVVKLHFARC